MKRMFGLSILIMVLTTGCSTMLGDFTVLSTYNFELQAESELVTREAKGSSMSTTVLFFTVGAPHLQTAVEKALQKSEADFLTNARIYEKEWSILLLGRKGFVVEGFAWRIKHDDVGSLLYDNNEILENDGLRYIPGKNSDEYEFVCLAD